MKKYLAILNILLITVAVYAGVSVFYKITTAQLDRSDFSAASNSLAPVPQNKPIRPLSDYQSIIERNIFDTEKGGGRPAEMVDIENLKPTDLKLTLLGTVAGDNNQAYAVIKDAAENLENLYRVGDTIQNATLTLILREKVVLRVDGKDEILKIEETTGHPQKSRSASRPFVDSSQNITLDRFRIETAGQNINTLMQQARIRPHFTNGAQDGLLLTGIRPNSLFRDMGLLSGDVITSVDGTNIKSVDDALKFYQSLKSSSNVKLQLKRRGRMKTIDYYIR